MKKQLTVLAILIMSTLGLKAQQGEIIYTDFEPDLCVAWVSTPYPHDTIKIDFDEDGTTDFMVFLSWHSTGEIAIDMISIWEHRYKISDNDSIVPTENVWPTHHGWLYPNWTWQHMFESGATHSEDYIGFRNTINEEHYHAWVWVYADIEYTSSPDKVWVYVDRMAYCTIPDYPLRWGQTNITEGVEEETIENDFSIYPNPTDDVLFVQTLRAMSLPDQSYRIINLMGQTVLSGRLTTETQQINIESLPAGMYFITVVGETRKFVVR